jgi:PAS domain S-box-containing protein
MAGKKSSTSSCASGGKKPAGPSSDRPSLVVGIGASSGGLEPIKTLVRGLPADKGIAVVIVQHMDADGEKLLASLLREVTSLEVVDATEAMTVQPNRIHIIPSRVRMGIGNGILSILVEDHCHNLQLPIDHFLCSLAVDQGERSVGILLSGAGMDGTQGMADIKEAGGFTLVQDPETTHYPDMIRSAMEATPVDAVLAVDKMPHYLLELTERLSSLSEKRRQEEGLKSVLSAVRSATGHDFHCYKRNTLVRRMHRRMALLHIDDFFDYARHMRIETKEANLLRRDLLIGVTEFFRQPEAWKLLEKEVIPALVERAAPQSTLRVWVPACSTGKEAYSLAMLLAEGVHSSGKKLGIQIFATDTDEQALDVARLGIYSEEELAGVSPARRSTFFTRKNGGFQVAKALRELMVFAPQNLTADPPFSRLDFISCRNLLIYLDQPIQRKIVSMFHFALRDGGFLFLGSAETINGRDEIFETVSKKWRIYRRIGIGRPTRLELPLRQTDHRAPFAGIPLPQPRPTLTIVAQQALLSRFAPPSVIVDGKGQLFYAHGAVEEYLRIAPGEQSGSVIDMAREGMRVRLRSAITRSAEDGRITTATARIKHGDTSVAIKITVSPLRYPREAEGLMLISFEEQRRIKPTVRTDAEVHQLGDVQQLEDELKITREELQSVIEQLEQSNEHLKASNEEVTAANEELQSSNEELETSKEELQSLNEELNAVNVSLEEKVEELEGTNNDVLNLLASTDIATLFLDRDFTIRRFTPAVTKLLKLIPGDIGRPIEDITRQFVDYSLLDDARRVLANLVPSCAEVRTTDGKWYSRRIMPYRTQDDRIEGMVITFVDVDEIKKTQEALDQSRQVAEQAAERAKVLARFPSENPNPVMRVAADGTLLYANQSALELRQWLLEPGKPVIVELAHLVDKALEYGVVSEELPVDERIFWLAVVPIRSENYVNIYGRDITSRKASEEALRRSEALLQVTEAVKGERQRLYEVMETLPVFVVLSAADYHVPFANRFFRERFGESHGRRCYEYLCNRSEPCEVCETFKVLQTKTPHHWEWSGQDGRHYDIFDYPFTDADGSKLILEMGIDITDRKLAESELRRHRDHLEELIRERTSELESANGRLQSEIVDRKVVEEALRESEAQLTTLVEHVAEGIIVSDLEGNLLHWNRAALEMHGYTSMDECRRHLPDFTDTYELSSLDGRVLSVDEWPLSRILAGEQLKDVEISIHRLKAPWQRIYNYGGSLVRDEQGQPLMAILTLGDITERKRSEEALRESEQRLNRAQEIAHLGSWELDLVTNRLTWSDEVYHIFGLQPQEFAATYEAFLDHVHPDDRALVNEAYSSSVLAGRDTYEIEHRIIRSDNGEIRLVHEKCEHFRDSSGRMILSIGMVHDITERKQAEEALRRLNAELEDRVRQRTADLQRRAEQLSMLASELTLAEQRERRRLAQVLHDHLQQLLVGARFGLEVISRRVDEQQRAKIAQVQGLLEESITASRSLTVELSPPILHEGGLGAGLDWLARWMKEKHGLIVDLEVDQQVVTDREDIKVLLFQSVRELLFNIVKHADVTRATVKAAMLDADNLRVVISDEGIGFDPEVMWDRASGVAAGFGLFSIRERLGMLGGRMEIESAPQMGSRVTLIAPTLFVQPGTKETIAEPARDTPAKAVAETVPVADGEGRKLRVMLVDDHGVMRQGLAAILSEEKDIEIVGQAADGQEAVEMAPQLLPDVILMDFSMPRMDGVAATRIIHTQLPQIRIIGLSMYEEADRAEAMIEAGASAYVTKSGRSEVLLAAIRNTP